MKAGRSFIHQTGPIHPKKKAPHVRGLSILDQDPQTLISTSTPLGSSIFIKASTVLEELE
jgi:hypothetical protein